MDLPAWFTANDEQSWDKGLAALSGRMFGIRGKRDGQDMICLSLCPVRKEIEDPRESGGAQGGFSGGQRIEFDPDAVVRFLPLVVLLLCVSLPIVPVDQKDAEFRLVRRSGLCARSNTISFFPLCRALPYAEIDHDLGAIEDVGATFADILHVMRDLGAAG